MANKNTSLDKWRDFFRGSNSDIFDIIQHAIMVAVTDCPNEFKLNRDRIAELLFSCKSTKCFGCDRVELALPNTTNNEIGKKSGGIETGTKESKASRDDDQREVVVEMTNGISNCSFGDIEALTDDLEGESMLVNEVLRIKDVLDNFQQETEEGLFDSLRRLELMPISVDTLKNTEIGKSVACLRAHKSADIKKFAKRLVNDWRDMVDAFYVATQAIADTPESEKKSVKDEGEEEEGGLPSPPLEEGAFLTSVNDMEFNDQFFEGLGEDDEGNLRNIGEFKQNRANGRGPNVLKPNIPRTKLESRPDSSSFPKERKAEPKKSQEAVLRQGPASRPNRPTAVESGPGRPKPPTGVSGPGRPKPLGQSRANNEMKPFQDSPQMKQAAPKQEKLNGGMNLEAAKRKLQERYQEAENAKKQRTIQMVELHDLPKQSGGPQRNLNMRPGNHNRHRGINRM